MPRFLAAAVLGVALIGCSAGGLRHPRAVMLRGAWLERP